MYALVLVIKMWFIMAFADEEWSLLQRTCDKCFGNLIASFLVISCASLSYINNQCVELSIKIIKECNIQIRCITLQQSKDVVSYCCNLNRKKPRKVSAFLIQNKEWPHNYIDLHVIATWNLFLWNCFLIISKEDNA